MQRKAVLPKILSASIRTFSYWWKCPDHPTVVKSRSFDDYQNAKADRDAHNRDFHPERVE